MVRKTKFALIAAVAVIGIATPALADGFHVIAHHKTVAHGRTLYDSATAPNSNGNWASDAEWSTAGRQNSGR